MNLEELDAAVITWGYDKGILPNPQPSKQFVKTLEEVQELAEAISEENEFEVKDAIGDIVVTLIMQCQAWDTTLEECLEQAYNTIAKRKGKMVDGVFVKES